MMEQSLILLYTTAVDVIKGGELETKIVYKVKGNPTSYSLLALSPWLILFLHNHYRNF